MKKRIAFSLIICLFLLTLCGCAGAQKPDPAALKPETAKVQTICNLATLECYYHNVAKSQTQGMLNIESTKKTFWIEYTGTVKIGIDFSKVTCVPEGDQVTITMPKAKVLGISLDESSYNEDSYYAEKNSILNGKITAAEQTAAVYEAQNQMKAAAEADEALLFAAQNRAKEMVENYIRQLGELSGTEYHINWVDAQENQPQTDAQE